MNEYEFKIIPKGDKFILVHDDAEHNPFSEVDFDTKSEAEGRLAGFFSDYAWNPEDDTFVDRYQECTLGCGGQESWCSCCHCYTQNCCVDYGTCWCS
jgi:hypothetical protein